MVCCTCGLRKLTNRPNCILNSAFRLQLLATVTATLLAFSHGIGLGWLSPILTELQSENTPLPFPVGIEEASWIGAALGLGSMFGCMLSGVILSYLGRKLCIYLIALPHISLWVLIYCAQSVEYLYAARFLGGVTGGSVYVVLPIFISEIADSSIRGTLSSMLMFAACFGTLCGYTLTSYLSYHLTPLLALVFPVSYLLCFCYFPETPQQLLRQQRLSAARNSFSFYRNCQQLAANSSAATQCGEDFEALRVIMAESKQVANLTWRDFTTQPALKALLTAVVMLLTNQFSGIFAFINYMSLVFQESSTSIDANVCSIVVGVMQLLGCYASILFVDRYGRKLLFLLSVGGVIVGLTVYGFYAAFMGKQGLWLPLVLMAAVVFIGSMGVQNLCFVMIVEIFPLKIRSAAVSFAFAFLSAMIFVTLKIFPIYLHYFGLSVTLWTQAAGCIIGFIYLAIYLPETKGKSMDAD